MTRLAAVWRRLPQARDERGSTAIETLLMATATMSLVLVVVAAGTSTEPPKPTTRRTPPPGRPHSSRA